VTDAEDGGWHHGFGLTVACGRGSGRRRVTAHTGCGSVAQRLRLTWLGRAVHGRQGESGCARIGESKGDVCFDARGGAADKDGAKTRGGDNGLGLVGTWLR
jgi:hypothetical protein